MVAREPQLIFRIGLFLWTDELLKMSSVCKLFHSQFSSREEALRLFSLTACIYGDAPAIHYNQLYMHSLLPIDAAQLYASYISQRVTVLSPLRFNSQKDILRFFDTVAGSQVSKPCFYKEFTINTIQSDCSSSEDSIEVGGCSVSLQLRKVLRGGIALAACLEGGGNIAVVKVRAWLPKEDQSFAASPIVLRAGLRMVDPLRATDAMGYWSDLCPVRLHKCNQLIVPCLVELREEW